MKNEPPAFDADRTIVVLQAGLRCFGRYTLVQKLGEGGMGVVWQARDEKLERDVALKFLPDHVRQDPEAVRDLQREVKRCLELTHANIVRVYDFVEDASAAAITMEYVPGKSLAARKAGSANGCLDADELAPLVAQLCPALDYAHTRAKIVHRDLKPANLLVTDDGTLKIADFGIARSLSETQTRLTRDLRGSTLTLSFAGPQQLDGAKPSPADDIYALGATLYDLLTGKPPFFRGDVIGQIRQAPPEPLAARRAELENAGAPIPPAWEETILACLAKRPEERPASAGDIAARLVPSSGTATPLPPPPPREPEAPRVPATPPPLPPPVPPPEPHSASEASPPASRSRSKLLAGAGAFLLLGLAAWWYFGSHLPAQRLLETERERTRQAELAREAAAADARRRDAEQRANARGGLIVSTIPAGADVAVGGFALEKSPATIKDARVGRYPVVVRLAGYEEKRVEAEVTENQFSTLQVTLVRSVGSAQIGSSPPGLSFVVAGERTERGTTPATLSKLPTGDYTVTFSRPGWAEQRATLKVERERTSSVLATFAPGAFEISSTPSGAEVSLQGRVLGRTPLKITEHPTGNFEFSLALRGYRIGTAAVNVQPRDTARTHVALTPDPRKLNDAECAYQALLLLGSLYPSPGTPLRLRDDRVFALGSTPEKTFGALDIGSFRAERGKDGDADVITYLVDDRKGGVLVASNRFLWSAKQQGTPEFEAALKASQQRVQLFRQAMDADNLKATLPAVFGNAPEIFTRRDDAIKVVQRVLLKNRLGGGTADRDGFNWGTGAEPRLYRNLTSISIREPSADAAVAAKTSKVASNALRVLTGQYRRAATSLYFEPGDRAEVERLRDALLYLMATSEAPVEPPPATSPGVQSAPRITATGTWKFQVVPLPGLPAKAPPAERFLILEQRGTTLTGKFQSYKIGETEIPERPLIEGSVNGVNIAFAAAPTKYTGTLEGDTIKGKYEVSGRGGGTPTIREWIATRVR